MRATGSRLVVVEVLFEIGGQYRDGGIAIANQDSKQARGGAPTVLVDHRTTSTANAAH
ncbi:hypothetical protein [Mycolicibacterium moriokaense]|uniref:hypothetical protein n=1 Tax=Mycolicibacterium moriokaense TaxID=39691 RepID=UPI0015E8B2D5|nr:hypothetical protein [Mycolicibacterium moriokaense]